MSHKITKGYLCWVDDMIVVMAINVKVDNLVQPSTWWVAVFTENSLKIHRQLLLSIRSHRSGPDSILCEMFQNPI